MNKVIDTNNTSNLVDILLMIIKFGYKVNLYNIINIIILFII